MKDKIFHFKEDTVTKKTLFKTFKIKIRKTNTHAKKSLNKVRHAQLSPPGGASVL